ncbi:diamine N-acetyltransferase [Aerococcus sp. 150760007-1]|uniref:GNAT family N-acetyltransferase n=1 Tax=Aerococcus urinaeequi TaxID=51665 RepID=A0ABR5ZY18_9LACT|nr:GNAT family N-acetyltransferase [Aerococcus urinaeequi]MBA5746638.1 GNAT family N-acetyltransferase [Aerococcus urinaeequi]MBA5829311.1 GNAT family N-acetyltransferase [Aerococcus urinaeequi]MBA5860326.1 GNAT family N-acetyltransferase [Aerococcus urinaeequi]
MTQLHQCSMADVDELRAVSIETYTDTFGEFNSDENMRVYLEDAYNRDKLLAELAEPNSQFFFLKENNETVGYLKLNLGDAQTEYIGDNLLEVERIYVRTAFLRNGYGTKLIQTAEETARELGVNGMWLGVWEHNQRALNFYSKMGFRHISQHSFFMADDEQIDLIYYKDL